ncbi:MAG: UDP-N-acetylmuramoyl-L-alanyl-D-glutamate--2,6-diaminopimelate ligase [Gammaproteobacteria bacterium]|nr:UDP-N-acetylmuramoyl-L-alanyl-D-glutamate--2,6-diaminopimelate ligase [Gammaproteobacteria bacterium]
MKLSELIQPWVSDINGDCAVSGLQNDSRQINAGDVFIAYPGAVADGRAHIADAIAKGAVAIIYDPKDIPVAAVLPTHVPCVPLENLARQPLAALASRFYGYPSEALNVTAVTGTNGKTTIAYQLAQAHQSLGHAAAYIGTLGQGKAQDLQPLINTTPDALCLQRLFADYQQQGIQQLCMEVSSHALSEHRVDEISFNEAIYTNLSYEHLDYHGTMDAYAEAKALLFAKLSLSWVILNQDDDYVAHMIAAVPKSVRQITYGLNNEADVRASNYQLHLHGSQFMVDSPWGQQELQIPSLGLFNIYNSLAVYSSLLTHGYSIDAVVAVMATLQPSPGRMEIVAQQPCVIVDFAHTPAALENALQALGRLQSASQSKVWVVFGCGGDRDKTKRPIMGRIASDYAAEIILTSDNPRHEDPEAILQDIAAGIPAGKAVTTMVDRRSAIQHALGAAGPNDIVLIAGKGHEAYQIIGDQRSEFSDQAEVRQLLRG